MREKTIRIQQFLAKCGVCSRRKAADLLKEKRIKVNGEPVLEPYRRIDPENDKVTMDDKVLRLRKYIYIVINKPKGVTTTKEDKFAEKKIIDLVPEKFRHLNPAGRLDKNSSGLILLTNDGQLLYRITHPKFQARKIYRVQIDKPISRIMIGRLEKGIILNGKKTAVCKINILSKRKLEIALHEGRKRQIRRMLEEYGCRVVDLCRVQEGPLKLGRLTPGEYRFLSIEEIARLYSITGLKKKL